MVVTTTDTNTSSNNSNNGFAVATSPQHVDTDIDPKELDQYLESTAGAAIASQISRRFPSSNAVSTAAVVQPSAMVLDIVQSTQTTTAPTATTTTAVATASVQKAIMMATATVDPPNNQASVADSVAVSVAAADNIPNQNGAGGGSGNMSLYYPQQAAESAASMPPYPTYMSNWANCYPNS